jgi:hypothetical protein
MVKFSQFDQDGYIKARDELRKFAEQAMTVVEKRLQHRLVLDRTAGPEDLGKPSWTSSFNWIYL